MRGTTIQPDEDAVDLFRTGLTTSLSSLSTQRQDVRKRDTTEGTQSHLKEIAATKTVAIMF